MPFPESDNPNPLRCPYMAQKTFNVKCYSVDYETGEKSAISVEGKTVRVIFEDPTGDDLAELSDGNVTKSGNTLTFTNPAAAATPPGGAKKMTGRWSCRDTTTNFPYAFGTWEVFDVALKDA